jgi:very-short-patch-repair endonuclease
MFPSVFLSPCGRGNKGEGVPGSLAKLSKMLRRRGTHAERILWLQLRRKQFGGFKFRRQEQIGKYIVDFVSFEIKLIIEVDGGQHNEDKHLQDDAVRSGWLTNQGFKVIRFWNNEILTNLDGVILSMIEVIREISPSPSPSSPIEGEEN